MESKFLRLSMATCSNILGYQWNPNSEDYQWRPCSAHEATKKNCPRGEPCLADTRYHD